MWSIRSVPNTFSAGAMDTTQDLLKMFRKGKASSRKGGFSGDLLYEVQAKETPATNPSLWTMIW